MHWIQRRHRVIQNKFKMLEDAKRKHMRMRLATRIRIREAKTLPLDQQIDALEKELSAPICPFCFLPVLSNPHICYES